MVRVDVRHGARTVTWSAVLATALLGAATAGCGASITTYDISAFFPLSSDKCAEYHGDQSSGGASTGCVVTRSECERAAADWRQATRDGRASTAAELSCD